MKKQDVLLKEYELCWKGVAHVNTRLWQSAAVFISGSLIALAWIGSREVSAGDWTEFAALTVIAVAIGFVLFAYLHIFNSWELLDRIEFYRAEEIEKELNLWRIRYRLMSRHEEKDIAQKEGELGRAEIERIQNMRAEIARRLGVTPEKLPSRRGANKAFRCIVGVLIGASGALIVRALLLALGLCGS